MYMIEDIYSEKKLNNFDIEADMQVNICGKSIRIKKIFSKVMLKYIKKWGYFYQ